MAYFELRTTLGALVLGAILAAAPRVGAGPMPDEEQVAPEPEPVSGPATQPADDGEPSSMEPLSDERTEEARRHFASGGARFEDGFYLEAIDHFNAAYEITSSPEILYNIGRCYEELDEPERAVDHFEMYLRLQPDAEDAREVEDRMIELRRSSADEADDGEADPDAPAAEWEWPPGFRIGVALGFGIALTGEWVYDPRRNVVPLDVMLHFPLIDWLYLTGAVTFGGFVGEDPKGVTAQGFPTSAVGLYVGLMAVKQLVGRLGFFGRLGFEPHFIFRDRHEIAYWLAVQGGVGLQIALNGGWGLTVEALANFGPVFVPKRDNFDPWADPPGPAADIGGRFGVVYAF